MSAHAWQAYRAKQELKIRKLRVALRAKQLLNSAFRKTPIDYIEIIEVLRRTDNEPL
jgi:hypothetical protein